MPIQGFSLLIESSIAVRLLERMGQEDIED